MTASTPVAFEDPQYRAAVVDLLGAIAYGEISAFERLAEDAKLAPTLEDKVAISSMACAEFGHVARLNERLAQLGVDPFEAMAPFRGPIDRFHEYTAPDDWYEGLIKAYVGDGMANDFYREIAAYLDPDTRDLVVRRSGGLRARGVRRRPGPRPRSPRTRGSVAGSRCGVAG